MLSEYSNNCFILLLCKVGTNAKFAASILTIDCIPSLVRVLGFVRLAVVENKLLNCFTSSTDSWEVIAKFNHDCDSDSTYIQAGNEDCNIGDQGKSSLWGVGLDMHAYAVYFKRNSL
jgi:hypothetical protein